MSIYGRVTIIIGLSIFYFILIILIHLLFDMIFVLGKKIVHVYIIISFSTATLTNFNRYVTYNNYLMRLIKRNCLVCLVDNGFVQYTYIWNGYNLMNNK